MGLFAGNMKLSTFLTAGACASVLGVGASVLFWPESVDEPEDEIVAEVNEIIHETPPPVPADNGPAMSGLDRTVLSYNGKDLGSEKLKDASPSLPYKINVYQDAGESTANRLKIDLDRDDAWDIKVSFGPSITRKVSSHDDEVYDVEEQWDGAAWVPVGAPPPEEASAGPVVPEILSWIGKDIGSAKLKDVTKGKIYKINVYQDEGHETANRAKLDKDRDDKWDMKVTYSDPPVRQVSSNDDEVYDVEEVWDGASWTAP
jgi:hypothetical protein